MATKDDEESHHKKPKLETTSLTELSDLPNEVLIRILSLLPTKSAVVTSLLSTRWRHLWVSITNLNFTEHIMFRNQRNRFVDFADRTMALRGNSSLVSFYLSCTILGDASRINHWITSATQCNVEDLSIYLYELQPQYLLPCSIFGCQSLVKLDLSMSDGYILQLPPSFTGLIRLNYLILSSITFTGDGSVEKLISGCPLLQELHIWYCKWENIQTVTIYAPKLEILEIDDRDGDYGDAKVCIVGDNLKSFTYEGILNHEYEIRASSTHLVDVDINLNGNVAADRCYKILHGLSGVQKLTLTEYFLEDLEDQLELLETIPVFGRLSKLCLYIHGSSDIWIDTVVMMKIFERCPHLEDLIISEPFSGLSELNPIPSCFQTHLKKVTIHHHIPDDNNCAINLFLINAAILEELEVFCRSDTFEVYRYGSNDYSYTIEEYQEELNQRAKISKDCRISAWLED